MGMLIFSKHKPASRAGASVLQQKFTAGPAHMAVATLERAPNARAAHWKVSHMDSDVDDAGAMRALLPMLQAQRPLLLYVQGYNSTPAACFERCDRLQALYGLEIVRFSWSSKKYLHDEGSELPGRIKGFNADPAPNLAHLFGAWRPVQPGDGLADTQGLTCAWWLVMALGGSSVAH
jgi:hypothetical protein